MDHTHIVRAADLDRYSPTRESQAVVPELVYLLLKQSIPPPSVCRVPYGDIVNQSGWDGIVEIEQAFLEYVPAGTSYWEIGTGADPKKKAAADFKKRTDELSDEERAKSSFVFVTSRSSAAGGWNEPEQTEWLKERKDTGWSDIKIIDGVKLADWLREFPGLGRWMAKKAGITASLGGIITPVEHWDLISSQGDQTDPPLPPQLFIVSRSNACAALEALFSGGLHRLFLFAESESDVEDFIAAYLSALDEEIGQEYANRCLFIDDEEAWRAVSELRQSHVLVASPRLGLDSERQDLQAVATRRGHTVVIPLCGALSGESPEIIQLRSPSPAQIEAALKEAKFSEFRARELGGIGGGRLSALRRHLLGLGSVPPYDTWDTARELAQAALVGQWNANNPADRQAVQEALGKDYGEWIETLRGDTLRSDSPLIQTDEKWRFVARGEAWNALGKRITNDDLDRFKAMAVTVLSERDPKFDLPKEERFAASLHGKALQYSSLLRMGVAETLALLGSRPQALSGCSQGKAEATALLLVRQLLNNGSWDRWASLGTHLPLLAEASPDAFLDAVESVLVDLSSTPFHEIFAQEGTGGIDGWNYMSGLLWALESLAWSSDYLARVSVILADIASIDPGGNWVNRPANSLADIFLPWHVQTSAPFEKRKNAIQAVLQEQPEVGWSLLLALLPNSHGFTTGCHKPVWREFIPRGWKDAVLQSEYGTQITAFTKLAVELAKLDSEKIVALIGRLSDLPRSAHESLFSHLSSQAVVGLAESERVPIWEKLDGLVRLHKKFPDADWVLPEKSIRRLEEVSSLLAPQTPSLKYHYLFSDRDLELFDEKGSYEEQRERLEKVRQAAVNEILSDVGLTGCLDFASTVASPYEVGKALGIVASEEIESDILPVLLDSDDEYVFRLVAGFVWARFWDRRTDWVDLVLGREWGVKHSAKFLTLLPFESEIWERASTHLGEASEDLYWKDVRINPYSRDRDLPAAIEKLLNYGREGAAVMCLARFTDDKSTLDETLAIRALIAVLNSEGGITELDGYQTVELIKRLQKSETADQDALFRIEWNFLPWLDRFSSGSPVTLEKRLAEDPKFFAEIVGLVFASKHDRKDEPVEPDERRQNFARNAFKLLTDWRCCPGLCDDETLDEESFKEWINEARRLTEETGHGEVAQNQIGHVLTYAPPDPGGLWIHEVVATVLNSRDTEKMRSGFTIGLLNQRGVHSFTHGKEERELAARNREKAEALDSRGFTRFGAAIRALAEQYDRQAEHDEKRDPFDD